MLEKGTQGKIVSDAAAHIAGCLFSAIEKNGSCTLVLAGGNSPRELYRQLSGRNPHTATSSPLPPWESIMLFWGDERCVPVNDTRGNYFMAFETLIEAAGIPEKNIYPMPHPVADHDEAARQYEKKLRSFFENRENGIRDSFPVFDVIILGMGNDGHTASLFPEDGNALAESTRWVIPVHAPQGQPSGYRLSLTLPVINNANNVIFFVTGESKEKMVLDITSGRRPDLPAARVKPEHGKLVWFYGK